MPCRLLQAAASAKDKRRGSSSPGAFEMDEHETTSMFQMTARALAATMVCFTLQSIMRKCMHAHMHAAHITQPRQHAKLPP